MDIELATTCAQNSTLSLSLSIFVTVFYAEADPMWKSENKYQNIFHFTTGANVLNCFSHQQCHRAERLCIWTALLQLVQNATFWIYRVKWRHAAAQGASERNRTRLAPSTCWKKIENNNEWYSLVFQVSPAQIGAHRCSRDLLSKV